MKIKKTVIVLHGWGLSGAKYKGLVEFLSHTLHVLAPDLPGFGNEPKMSRQMDLSDYVYFVDTLMKKENTTKAILIGHSFGGRIAIKYAWEHPEKVSKIILTGVPIIRHISLFKRVAFLLAMSGKKTTKVLPNKLQSFLRKLLYFTLGEWDYYKAGDLQGTFKNIINEDLVQYMEVLKIPILLVWGENDSFTPVSDVAIIKKHVSYAQVAIVSHVGHNLPYAYPMLFYQKIRSFL